MKRVAEWSLVVLLAGCCGCGASRQATPATAESYYRDGQIELAKGHCLKASELFQRVVTSFPGSDYIDDAQYGLGEAHLCAREYTEAIFEYERVVSDYRNSPYVDDAALKIGICYYKESLPTHLDQKETMTAMEHLNRFIEDYPDSPLVSQAQEYLMLAQSKLAEKAYRTAKGYSSWGNEESALIYYRVTIERYGQTKWAVSAAREAAMILEKQGKASEAAEMLKAASDAADEDGLKQGAGGQRDARATSRDR